MRNCTDYVALAREPLSIRVEHPTYSLIRVAQLTSCHSMTFLSSLSSVSSFSFTNELARSASKLVDEAALRLKESELGQKALEVTTQAEQKLKDTCSEMVSKTTSSELGKKVSKIATQTNKKVESSCSRSRLTQGHTYLKRLYKLADTYSEIINKTTPEEFKQACEEFEQANTKVNQAKEGFKQARTKVNQTEEEFKQAHTKVNQAKEEFSKIPELSKTCECIKGKFEEIAESFLAVSGKQMSATAAPKEETAATDSADFDYAEFSSFIKDCCSPFSNGELTYLRKIFECTSQVEFANKNIAELLLPFVCSAIPIFEAKKEDKNWEDKAAEVKEKHRITMARELSGHIPPFPEKSTRETAELAANSIVDFLYSKNNVLPAYLFYDLPDDCLQQIYQCMAEWGEILGMPALLQALRPEIAAFFKIPQKQKTNASTILKVDKESFVSHQHYQERLIELYQSIYQHRHLKKLETEAIEEAEEFKKACYTFLNPPQYSASFQGHEANLQQSLQQFKTALTELWEAGAEQCFDSDKIIAWQVNNIISNKQGSSAKKFSNNRENLEIHSRLQNTFALVNNADRINSSLLAWPVSLWSQFVHGEIQHVLSDSKLKTTAHELLKVLPEEDQLALVRLQAEFTAPQLSISISVPENTITNQPLTTDSIFKTTLSSLLNALQAIQQTFKNLYDITWAICISYMQSILGHLQHLSGKIHPSSEEAPLDLQLKDLPSENGKIAQDDILNASEVINLPLSIQPSDTEKNQHSVAKNLLCTEIIEDLETKLNQNDIINRVDFEGEESCTTLLETDPRILISTLFKEFSDANVFPSVSFNEYDYKNSHSDYTKKHTLISRLQDFCDHSPYFFDNRDEFLLISDILGASSYIQKYLMDRQVLPLFMSKGKTPSTKEIQKSCNYFFSREEDGIKLITSFKYDEANEHDKKNKTFHLEEHAHTDERGNSIHLEIALKINKNNQLKRITILPAESSYHYNNEEVSLPIDTSSQRQETAMQLEANSSQSSLNTLVDKPIRTSTSSRTPRRFGMLHRSSSGSADSFPGIPMDNLA